MKIVIILSLFFSSLFSVEKTIKELQEEFFHDVIETRIYKKHYNKYILSACGQDDILCQTKLIKKIRNNSVVKKNRVLKNDINYMRALTSESKEYIDKLILKLKKELVNVTLKDHEFISTIDLSRQTLIIFLYDKKNDVFHKIGTDLISSGDKNREGEITWGDDHFFDTPTGVFQIKEGWRSEGQYKTYKDETYQPYGSKDRFIFHVGKIETTRYNVFDRNKQKIINQKNWVIIDDTVNFALHSHRSKAPLGIASSHGCVRMSDELNYFLDTNAVLHKRFFRDDKWRLRFTKKPKNLKYQEFAGEYIVIFDKI
ncbi:MAG TPA: hypothetical protein ENK66_06610 [Arcobacter sp.]|jgi:hypothetical protein|nr:hypothetical protein [Arcobacter sp.]